MQLADVITGCTVSYVAGQPEHHRTLFTDKVQPLLRSDGGRIGGYGVKIHPDFRYGNLYHWLFSDDHLWARPLPITGLRYAESPDEP